MRVITARSGRCSIGFGSLVAVALALADIVEAALVAVALALADVVAGFAYLACEAQTLSTSLCHGFQDWVRPLG